MRPHLLDVVFAPRRRDGLGGVYKVPEDPPSILPGLWIATLVVLLLPSPGKQRYRIQERDMFQAWQVVANTLTLV